MTSFMLHMQYGVPMSAVLLYLNTCPVCAGTKKISKKKKNPLKFIISEHVGTRSQVDLIDMRSFEAWQCTLQRRLVKVDGRE